MADTAPALDLEHNHRGDPDGPFEMVRCPDPPFRGPGRAFRGPLRYEVETASPQLVAGIPFSVYVKIANPYDVPVVVKQVRTRLPIEFLNPEVENPGLLKWLKRTFKADVNETVEKGFSHNTVEAVSMSSSNSESDELLLQPGNAGLKRFTVSTRRKIMFSPATYDFHIQIAYEMDGLENSDAIKKQFSIRAPMSALMWGSICGSVMGNLLRAAYDTASGFPAVLITPPFLSAVLGSVILAAVLIVAFARKKDVQPFISVEDFWGGFFVGITAGYIGKPLMDQYLKFVTH